jgi:hypothetical protein
MAYKFYNAYLNVAPSSPQQNYKDDLQAMIDDQFDNASDTYIIQEELTPGTLIWTDVDVRITHAINNQTGEKLGDDWRNVIFKNIDHVYGLGHRYQFNGFYWITTNTDFYKYVTASAVVRRCNWILKWYNEFGKLQQEPCIVEYYKFTPMKNIIDNQYMLIGEKIRYITLQNNSETYKILRNRRFIIDRIAYRVISTDSVTKPGLYLLTVQEHQINPSVDDLTNSVANAYGNSVYTIDITNPDIVFSVGSTPIQLNTVVKLDGQVVTDTVVLYKSSNTSVATVNSSGIVSAVANGNAMITAYLYENDAVYDNLNVAVYSIPVQNIVEVISGADSIQNGLTSQYSIYKIINGVQQSDSYTFSLTGSGATMQIIDANHVNITANVDNGSVVLNAKNNVSGVTISKTIQLVALW